MPRIRSVKPEYWTDGKVVGLPLAARLLFIGAWNFARCDHGHLDDDAESLKLRVLPADDVNARELLDAIIESGLMDRYEIDGRKFLHIRRFEDHQKVETRWNSRCPYCPLHNSANLAETPATTPGKGLGRGGEGLGRVSNKAFEKLWASYPTRNGTKGSKKNALAVWRGLSEAKRTQALTALPTYARAVGSYPKDAERYLRGEMWEGLDASKIGTNDSAYSNESEWTPAERGLAP